MSDALGEFLAKHDWGVVGQTYGWSVIRDTENPDVVRFGVSARDGERFLVRCECSGYPEKPPSVVFINELGSKDDPKAWPHGDSTFEGVVKPPHDCFLCTSLTREGLDRHPNWRQDKANNAWDSSIHTLMDIFNLVTRLLNDTHYAGRRRK